MAEYVTSGRLVAREASLRRRLVTPEGLSFALSNHEFYATLSGLAWYLWRRTMLGTIVTGMAVFTLLRVFL